MVHGSPSGFRRQNKSVSIRLGIQGHYVNIIRTDCSVLNLNIAEHNIIKTDCYFFNANTYITSRKEE